MPKGLVELNKYLGLVDPQKPKPLNRLDTIDRQILLLHLQGKPATEVAEQLHVTTRRIRKVLQSQLGQMVIEDYFRFCDQEFASLYQLSVSAIREALDSKQPMETRLKAADKFLRAHGKYDSGAMKELTAEDVVRRILEVKVTEERKITHRGSNNA